MKLFAFQILFTLKRKKGYDTMPLEVAIEKELIDIDEAINELVFFYMFLCDQQTRSTCNMDGAAKFAVELCKYTLECYGMDCFYQDIECYRQYWRDGETIISAILDYCAGLGFYDLFIDLPIKISTSSQFRELLKCKPRGLFNG